MLDVWIEALDFCQNGVPTRISPLQCLICLWGRRVNWGSVIAAACGIIGATGASGAADAACAGCGTGSGSNNTTKSTLLVKSLWIDSRPSCWSLKTLPSVFWEIRNGNNLWRYDKVTDLTFITFVICILQAGIPGYKAPTDFTTKRRHLVEEFNRIKILVLKKISKSQSVTLMMDSWSSKRICWYIGFIMEGVTVNLEKFTTFLCLRQMTGRHTREAFFPSLKT